jgi:hypothetical protein
VGSSRRDQLVRANADLYLSILKFSWHLVVSRSAEGFVAGRDFASTGSRAILPSLGPAMTFVSQQSELCAVVMYRAGCAIGISSKW